jgi:hypothetical protein
MSVTIWTDDEMEDSRDQGTQGATRPSQCATKTAGRDRPDNAIATARYLQNIFCFHEDLLLVIFESALMSGVCQW